MFYVEIAQDAPKYRGHLIPKAELIKYIAKDSALYRSVYLYDEDAKDIIDKEGSVRNFYGVRHLDNILVDIDKGDNTDEHTRDKLHAFLYALSAEHQVNTRKSTQVYFSGTGYHVSIHGGVFNFPSSQNLPFSVRTTMHKLFPDIDHSIYIRSGIYRVQHSLNYKTGLYKIPLTHSEAENSSIDEIKELAKTQRLSYPYIELIGEGELEDAVITEAPRIRQLGAKVREPSNMVPCVQKMLSLGPQPGSRNNVLHRIVSHFRRHGVPSEYTKVSMLHWNNKSLDENMVIEKVEYAYDKGYQYGCHDKYMAQHCRTNCIFFKRKDYLIDVKTSADLQEEYVKRIRTDFSGRILELGKMLGLSDRTEVNIYPGELVTIFGPTGSSKTTLAQNLILGVDMMNNRINTDWQIPTLYLSLELSGWLMHRRHLQIVSDSNRETAEDTFEELYEQHQNELQHLSVQTISPTIEQIRDKIRELQPAVVVVDYIDLIETPPHIKGEYEQVKYISHNLSNMAVNLDIIILQVSQVSRDYSRNEVLDLYAGKGSGAIENASRKVIGLNGQANSDEKHIQMFKNTDGELFECDVAWTPSFRLRRVLNG
tara:strand:- start:2262 stop:4046 length:1785 start_codon:yes stop_codon:yes gene_type:complete